MAYRIARPGELAWLTRDHAPDEAARHTAELSELLGLGTGRANLWRYEPGAQGRRHRHAQQEETFVVLAGTLTMYLGDPPEDFVHWRAQALHDAAHDYPRRRAFCDSVDLDVLRLAPQALAGRLDVARAELRARVEEELSGTA